MPNDDKRTARMRRRQRPSSRPDEYRNRAWIGQLAADNPSQCRAKSANLETLPSRRILTIDFRKTSMKKTFPCSSTTRLNERCPKAGEVGHRKIAPMYSRIADRDVLLVIVSFDRPFRVIRFQAAIISNEPLDSSETTALAVIRACVAVPSCQSCPGHLPGHHCSESLSDFETEPLF